MDYAELERLLINWGRWAKSTVPQSTSSIFSVLKQLKECRESDEDGGTNGQSAPNSAINEQEALLVERAICRLPKRLWTEKQSVELLKAKYLNPRVPLLAIARTQGLSKNVAQEMLDEAKRRLKTIIEYNI